MQNINENFYSIVLLKVWIEAEVLGTKYYENQLLSPSFLEKNNFEPTSFKQYYNESIDTEYFYLMSATRLCLLVRKRPVLTYKNANPDDI